MLDLAANIDPAFLTDRIDELSTRLILDGVASLGPLDFERLGQAAAELGNGPLADAAQHIGESIAAVSTQPVSERTRLVSSGLVELRRLLDASPIGPPLAVSASPLCASQPRTGEGPAPPRNNSLAADEGLIREFVTESSEHLVSIEGQLLLLERDNTATEALHSIFRGFHTIKGLAGFLEFAEIRSLAHEVETLLDLARTSLLVVSPAVVDVVLESTDVLRRELAAIAQRLAGHKPPPTQVDAALLDRIRQAARGESSTPEPCSSQAAVAVESVHDAAREPVFQERRVGDVRSVRIATAKLDQLMDMVGEMVIAQTLIGHSSALESLSDATLQRNLTQLARITADVQRIATGMRMVPIGLQFQKTARVVRDLARRAGKQVARTRNWTRPSPRSSPIRCCTWSATPSTTASSRPRNGLPWVKIPPPASASRPAIGRARSWSPSPMTGAAWIAKRSWPRRTGTA
jgi:two-component system chemotaxis sensor kinase CheA